MKEFTQDEITRYHEVRMYWLSLAVCWLTNNECQNLGYVLSEPNRFALKISGQQSQDVLRTAKAFQALPLTKRKYALQKAYVRNTYNAQRYHPMMKDCLRGLASMGQRGYTLQKLEMQLADMFQTQYDELKTLADTKLAPMGIENAGEQALIFCWESIIAEKKLPVKNPVIRDSLNWKSNNRFIVFENLLKLVNKPESEEFKHFATSMILSYLREYHGRSPEKEIQVEHLEGLVRHSQTEAEFEELEQRQELEYLLSLITNPKDKKVVELALECEAKGYTTEEKQAKLEASHDEFGLTLGGYYKRLERMRNKYPELNKYLQPFRKKQ